MKALTWMALLWAWLGLVACGAQAEAASVPVPYRGRGMFIRRQIRHNADLNTSRLIENSLLTG